jgi:DNA-binding protein HU-beta
MAQITSKIKLAREMASATGLPPKKVIEVLDQLAVIAYREASHDFVIPGICKIKVVQKKAARRRNPFTGKTLLIGERQALKITPLKKARDIITPNPGLIIQVLDDPPPAEKRTEETASQPDAHPSPPAESPLASSGLESPPPSAPAALPVESEEGQIVFPCSACGSILAAPPKNAGEKADCPYCGAPIQVPEKKAVPETPPTPRRANAPVSDFILFSCKACHQEIEAPTDMLGMDVECPACGTALTVPLPNSQPAPSLQPAPATASSSADSPKGNRSSMTIRIDLSDLE